MKKVFGLVLCLMILVMGTALAEAGFGDVMEVVKCNEFITLRAEPSTQAEALERIPLGATVRRLGFDDGKFVRVLYGDRAGYVLSEYLGRVQTTAVAYADVRVDVGSQEYYNVNLFLTNFTEQYFGSPYGYFDAQTLSDQELVQFAIEHIWFNRPDYIEWGEWDECNVRLSAEYIAPVCEKYFGRAPESMLSLYMDYFDGYYYWTETGGHVPGGFALMHDIERVGADKYRAEFFVYGQGYGWESDVYRMDAIDVACEHPEYLSKYQPTGCAVFSAADLLDRSTWVLESLCMDWEV